MTLKNYYKKGLIIPSILTIAFNLIYSIMVLIIGKNYTSEWITNEFIFFVAIGMVISNAAFICGLSLTIFLNNYENVRNNLILSFLSWFLMPGIWIGYVLSKYIYYMINSHLIDSESVFVLFNTIPFIIGLIYTFIRFQLAKSRQSI